MLSVFSRLNLMILCVQSSKRLLEILNLPVFRDLTDFSLFISCPHHVSPMVLRCSSTFAVNFSRSLVRDGMVSA